MVTCVAVDLPWPDKRLWDNNRAFRMQKAAAKKEARALAWGLACEAGLHWVRWPNAYIVVTASPPDGRKRDVHNLPTVLKPHIDGVADAMGCDDAGFQVQFPLVWGPKVSGGGILFTIRKDVG